MALVSIPESSSEITTQFYESKFLKWKGYYDEIPILRGVVNSIADSVTASWRIRGNNADEVTTVLNNIEGNGKETFKTLMCNAIKTGIVGGDSFFEIVTNDDLGVENIVMLPSENIRINIKNGKIKNYEEINAPVGERTSKWKPEEIFHYVNNPIGAMVHGTSDVEPLTNLLIALKQVQDDMYKYYKNYGTPLEVVEYDSDDETEIEQFKSDYIGQRFRRPKQIFLTKDLAKINFFEPAGRLDPATWHRLIVDQMLASMRVPDLALGQGTVNSEESSRMKYSGFRQLVRMKQQLLEEQLQRQLFPQIDPSATPSIEFSFAAEPEEEKFNRLMAAFSQVNASELAPDIKGLTLIKLLQDAGVIPNE